MVLMSPEGLQIKCLLINSQDHVCNCQFSVQYKQELAGQVIYTIYIMVQFMNKKNNIKVIFINTGVGTVNSVNVSQ